MVEIFKGMEKDFFDCILQIVENFKYVYIKVHILREKEISGQTFKGPYTNR